MAVLRVFLILLHFTVRHGHLIPPNKTLLYHTAHRQIVAADSLISNLEDVANSTLPLVLPGNFGITFSDQDDIGFGTQSIDGSGTQSNGGSGTQSNGGSGAQSNGGSRAQLASVARNGSTSGLILLNLTAEAERAARAADSLRECLVDLDELMDPDMQKDRALSRQLRGVLRSTSRLIEVTLELFDRLRGEVRR
eukprot:GFKZ01012752.1.p1 GENE.GFKZ01012752.1~~GFKZ01012752.1.p1  ORF type:complete len:194 (+),score=13.97 GFKZ01012752.1:28-609(+)